MVFYYLRNQFSTSFSFKIFEPFIAPHLHDLAGMLDLKKTDLGLTLKLTIFKSKTVLEDSTVV